MKALVTGCAGFIGSHLTDRLIEEGFEVIGIDNLTSGLRSNINPKCKFMKMDIRDPLVHDLVSEVRYVFHQAAMGSVPRSFEQPDEYKSVNIDGFYNVLRACEHHRVKKLVYASSSSVYGDNKKLPKREDEIGKQLSPYSFTKRVNELMCEPATIPTVGLRYFNVFGPRQRSDSAYSAVIPRWIDAMTNRRDIVIHGDGSAFRDFTYVSNVVEANILAALTYTPQKAEVYNVGTQLYTLLNQLVALIRHATNTPKEYLEECIRWDLEAKIPITQSIASIEKIREQLQYEVEVGIQEGIKRTVNEYTMCSPRANTATQITAQP